MAIDNEAARATPRTERVAQICSTDSEHTDLIAYNIMYRHATTLERELSAACQRIAGLEGELAQESETSKNLAHAYVVMREHLLRAESRATTAESRLAEVEAKAARYEHVRRLNVPQFSDLFVRALTGEGAFDDLVDSAIRHLKDKS